MAKRLILKDICVAFQKNKVLQNLSGEFAVGRPNLIVGRAGSGKSTLLQVIAGFLRPDSGKIYLDDQPFIAEGNFSLTFQNPETLFFNATVAEEVAFSLKMRKLPDAEIKQRTHDCLERWGLAPDVYSTKHPLELSGGEKRRVALAACTIFMPPVILLDEPLAGLDAHGQEALAEMLEEMAQQHIVITVTHEPETFLGRSSEVLFLQESKFSWLKTPQFISRAMNEPGFYPLPKWYSQALKSLPDTADFPTVKAQAVYDFIIQAEKNNANQL